jgi:ketosteroid isomerase-like protein
MSMEELERSVREWIDAWGAEVAAVDLVGGRRRFDDGLVAFGTHAFAVEGADAVHDQQWSQVWPTIEGFRFLTDRLIVQPSPDGLQAVAIVSWDSTGIAADGSHFDRPGRATVVLVRDALDAPVARHPHPLLARTRRPRPLVRLAPGRHDVSGHR